MTDDEKAWQLQTAVRNDRWFKTYWALRSWQATALGLGNPASGLAATVLENPPGFDQMLQGLTAVCEKCDPPFNFPLDFVAEGRRLAGEVQIAINAPHPKENVYQAAICAMRQWGWNGNHLHDHLLFRGESDSTWSTRRFATSIYRRNPDQTELKKRRRKIDLAAHWYRKRFPDRKDTDLELLAIFQHYGIWTWLLDVSTSVYAALFFASGHEEKIGVVFVYSIKELQEHHALAPELVPPIRLIKPRFVPRIDRQYGLFLEGGHGWSTRHLVLNQLQFKQVPGMQFEDPGLGITTKRLLASEGDWGWFEAELPRMFATVEQDRKRDAGKGVISDLFAKYEADLKQDVHDARVLDLGEIKSPAWPPELEQLTPCAERCMSSHPQIIEDRRKAAAKALARYHQLLCADDTCSFFIGSLHAYIDAARSMAYELVKANPTDISVLASSYNGRADTAEDRVLLQTALKQFTAETKVTSI